MATDKNILAGFAAFWGATAFHVFDNRRRAGAWLIDDLLAFRTFPKMTIIITLVSARQGFIASPLTLGRLSSAKDGRQD